MKKILWITRMAPADIDSAGLILQYRLLEILSRHYEVTVLSHKEDYGVNPLLKIGIKAIKIKNTEHVVNLVANNKYNIVIFNWWDLANTYLQRIRRYVDKVIINTIDVEFVRLQRAKNLGFEVNDQRATELKTYSWANLVWFVTKDDQHSVKMYLPDLNSEVIPIPANIKYRNPSKVNPHIVYFIGNFLHQPNVDAGRMLCRDIFPKLSENTHLYIMGKWPPQDLQKYANNRLHVTGIVYDLPKYLNQMHICVAPLRYGAGLKGKVVEAMSYGIPVIGSDIAFEGLDVRHKENAIIANDADSIIRGIQDLQDDIQLAFDIGRKGQDLIKSFSNKAIEPILINSIEGLLK